LRLAFCLFNRCCQILIGIVLFWSAVEHLKNPFFFLSSVLKYKLLDAEIAKIVALFLPTVQLLLAASLVLGIQKRLSIGAVAVLLSLFTFVQATALARGLTIGCGCFGAGHDDPITLFSVFRVGSLATVAWCSLSFEFRVLVTSKRE
jgi:hypothetical protein